MNADATDKEQHIVSLMVTVLEEKGPLDENALAYYVHEKNKLNPVFGEQLTYTIYNTNQIFFGGVQHTLIATFSQRYDFFTEVKNRFYDQDDEPRWDIRIALASKPHQEFKVECYPNYKQAYVALDEKFALIKEKPELLKEEDVLTISLPSKYSLVKTGSNVTVPYNDYVSAYFNLVKKIRAVKEDPSLLDLPDDWLDKVIGISY